MTTWHEVEGQPRGRILLVLRGRGSARSIALIAGPTVYICDECVKLCNDVLAQDLDRLPSAAERSLVVPAQTWLLRVGWAAV